MLPRQKESSCCGQQAGHFVFRLRPPQVVFDQETTPPALPLKKKKNEVKRESNECMIDALFTPVLVGPIVALVERRCVPGRLTVPAPRALLLHGSGFVEDWQGCVP